MEQSKALEIFNGLMLGDGSLSFGGGITARFRISRDDTRDNHDYLLGIVEALISLGVGVTPEQPKSYMTRQSSGNMRKILSLDSQSSPFLTEQYHLWIDPDDPKRRMIPDSLMKITPITLTYWFESDGSTAWSAGNLVKLELHSCQFGHKGNLVLQKLMSDIGIQMQLSRRWDGRTDKEYWGLITRNAAKVNKILDMVEPHIHPPYEYKIKRPWLKRRIIDNKQVKGPFVWKGGEWSQGAMPNG